MVSIFQSGGIALKRALVLVKANPHYRRDAFEAGLKANGFKLVNRLDDPGPGDALLTWNLTGLDRLASLFKQRGGKVIVAENAYLSPAGVPQMYALSEGGHNGAGRIPFVAEESRWRALGVELKPWRRDGKHILVAAQRGIGAKDMASPHGWHQRFAEKLQRATKRHVRIRAHPGHAGKGRSLAEDLRDAWAVVIWNSSVGVHALAAGIPVFYAAPHWICSRAAVPLTAGADIERPNLSYLDREEAMKRMAHGQFHYQEIATGEPIRRVLEC